MNDRFRARRPFGFKTQPTTTSLHRTFVFIPGRPLLAELRQPLTTLLCRSAMACRFVSFCTEAVMTALIGIATPASPLFSTCESCFCAFQGY